MSNVDYKKRVIILSFICAIVIIALVMTFISLIQSLKEDKSDPIEKHLYATVLESGNNYIRVGEIDSDNSYLFKTKDKYDKGDLVSIEYIEDNDDLTTKKIDIVAKKEELDALEEVEEEPISTTTSSGISSTTSISKSSIKTTSRSSSKRVTTTSRTSNNDNLVIDYVKNEYNSYGNYTKEKSIPEKAKQGFITIVDFIFYDGTIKGKKFDDLTSAAKAKVIYYALLIDNKIDGKWPNYKETIKNKTYELKAKLIAKYMDITSSLCEGHPDACEQAKEDLNVLKKSLNITREVIIKAVKYVSAKGYELTTIIKNWYETWRNDA